MWLRSYETILLARLRVASVILLAISFVSWAMAAIASLAGAKGAAHGMALGFGAAGLLGGLTWMVYCVLAGPRWCRHAWRRIREFREEA